MRRELERSAACGQGFTCIFHEACEHLPELGSITGDGTNDTHVQSPVDFRRARAFLAFDELAYQLIQVDQSRFAIGIEKLESTSSRTDR